MICFLKAKLIFLKVHFCKHGRLRSAQILPIAFYGMKLIPYKAFNNSFMLIFYSGLKKVILIAVNMELNHQLTRLSVKENFHGRVDQALEINKFLLISRSNGMSASSWMFFFLNRYVRSRTSAHKIVYFQSAFPSTCARYLG